MKSHILVTLRPISTNIKGRCEVEIKMYDSNGKEFFDLDQHFLTQKEALEFINNLNNARQTIILAL